jgi:hypothetical protein
MTTDDFDRRTPTDPLGLAEAVAAGRLTVEAAEDALRAGVADRRDRIRQIEEFRELLGALRGVRRHAEAFRSGYRAIDAETVTSARPGQASRRIDPRDVRVRRRPQNRSSRWAPAGALLAAAVLVVAVLAIPRLIPTVTASPSPSASTIAVAPSPSPSRSTTPSTSPTPTPTATPKPRPTSAAPNIPAVPNGLLPGAPEAFMWSSTSTGRIEIWRWTPGKAMTRVARVDGGLPGTDNAVRRTVVAAPDGRAFVIAETQTADGNGQIRLVDAKGAPRYSAKTAGDPGIVWSEDGSRVAFAVIPNPWTVLTSRTDGSWASRTYQVPAADPVALFAFSSDGDWLYGYKTQVEADFWERPVRMSMSSGAFAAVKPFPAGAGGVSVSNTTSKSDQVDPATGAFVDSGTARGGGWEVRRNGGATPLQGQIVGLTEGQPVVWGPGKLVTIDEGRLSSFARSGGVDLATAVPGGGVAAPFFSMKAGSYRASLLGVRATFALLGVGAKSADAATDRQPTWDELVMIDEQSGATAVLVPGSGQPSQVHFAGWNSALIGAQ